MGGRDSGLRVFVLLHPGFFTLFSTKKETYISLNPMGVLRTIFDKKGRRRKNFPFARPLELNTSSEVFNRAG